MEIGTIIVALIAVFIAWKVLSGLIKLATIAIIVLGGLWFLNSGVIAS